MYPVFMYTKHVYKFTKHIQPYTKPATAKSRDNVRVQVKHYNVKTAQFIKSLGVYWWIVLMGSGCTLSVADLTTIRNKWKWVDGFNRPHGPWVQRRTRLLKWHYTGAIYAVTPFMLMCIENTAVYLLQMLEYSVKQHAQNLLQCSI